MASCNTSKFHLQLADNNDFILMKGTGSANAKQQGRVKRILVIAGGVTGLTTAWALLDEGYAVTVVSEKWATLEDRLTSQIAGALWEYPPAVCGQHTNPKSLERSKKWSVTTYKVLEQLMEMFPKEPHGVKMRMSNFFLYENIEKNAVEFRKMKEISSIKEIRAFKRDSSLSRKPLISPASGATDAYQHLAPVIDTDAYMFWLKEVVRSKGAIFVTSRISGDLLTQEDALLKQYCSDIIINATGLGSLELAADKTVYPLRGALIRVLNDGSRFPKIEETYAVSHDEAHEEVEDIIFIVPRNDNMLVLGGLAQENEWNLDLTIDSPEIVRMRQRCEKFMPALKNAEYDVDPIVQGLRPYSGANTRIEREPRFKPDGSGSKIIHTYGHGGAGYSLAYGCAAEVLTLVRDIRQSESWSIFPLKHRDSRSI